MFEERTYNRTFYSAPQSVTSLVAAFVEPTIIVAAYIAISLQFDEPIERPALTLCLLVFALTFPGRNRFRENLINASCDKACDPRATSKARSTSNHLRGLRN